ncbi:MAG TPA: hypothetical protein VGM36_10235 [Rhizomicrobium sp.]|jgi:hypothetical protein
MNGHDMLIALDARGPHHDIVLSDNAIYAPLIGSWDLEVFDLEGDGARRVSNGEWHFGWVLEGRALQDVLVVPSRSERRNGTPVKGNRCATALRIFDPASSLWRVHFFNPVNQGQEILLGEQQGTDIVQKGVDANGVTLREIFSEITADAFTWRREVANNFGGWKLKSEYIAKRRS